MAAADVQYIVAQRINRLIKELKDIGQSDAQIMGALDNINLSALYNQIAENDRQIQQNNLDIQNNYRQTEGNVATSEQIMTRLNECSELEFYYLRKHEELMKTFKFTVNLFDKYKYATQLLLFLINNIYRSIEPQPTDPGVQPAAPGPGEVIIRVDDDRGKLIEFYTKDGRNSTKQYTIDRNGHYVIVIPSNLTSLRLPKKIITNMTKLLRDQAAVQDVITNMSNTVGRNPLDDRRLLQPQPARPAAAV